MSAGPMSATSTSFFSWGIRCDAVLWRPDQRAERGSDRQAAGGPTDELAAGIVMCHGFRGIKEWFLPATAAAFQRAGFTVLTFDYRGFGGSDGPTGSLVPADQVEDIRNALTFLGAQDWVDDQRLGLWGTSFGCSNVIAAAAADTRAKAVVGQVGIGSVPRAWVARMPAEKRERLLADLAEDRVRRALTGVSKAIDPAEILDNRQSHAAFEKAQAELPQIATTMPLAAIERVFEFAPEDVVARIAPRPAAAHRRSRRPGRAGRGDPAAVRPGRRAQALGCLGYRPLRDLRAAVA